MGWYYTQRAKGEATNLEWFRREFCPQNPDRLIDGMTKGGVFYGAYRTDDGDVTALVVLTQWTRGEYNFGYKDMSESMGPWDANCPERILDLLTDPAPNEYAERWRAKARAMIAARKAKPKVKAGDTVRFAIPIKFTNGTEQDTFRFVKGSTFTANYGRYQITRWRDREYAVVA